MVFRRKRDLGDEVSGLVDSLAAFVSTLGELVRSVGAWLGTAGMAAVSQGADVVSAQTGELRAASRARIRSAKRTGRTALFKVALVGLLLWWLDRDLSRS